MLFGNNKPGDNFKVKEFKTYAWDRTVGTVKKFRRVFERAELNYLSEELSIYNKLFDEKDWSCEIKFVANLYIGEDKTEQICEKHEKIEVSKEENLFKYNYGWGSDDRGSFWKEGTYEWEAYIDDELVSTTKFYIEDYGKVTADDNPYMVAKSLKTYESPFGDLAETKRVYLKSFDVKNTRYIMGEFKFINNLEEEWNCELFFNFYDDTGMLVGSGDSLTKITPHIGPYEDYTVTAGWGGDEPGIWIHDSYTLEVVFMDTTVAVIPFSVGDEDVKRLSNYEALLNDEVDSLFNNDVLNKLEDEPSVSNDDKKEETTTKTDNDSDVELYIDDRPVEEILAELDSLIGLENIKAKVREYIDYVSFIQLREESGIKEEDQVVLHSILTGNPGTGKTTVVKLLGKIFKSMGLLSKGHVHIVEANDLISGFIRQTGKDTKEAIEKARGGILFIDEAYMLFKDTTSNDFGPEAIAALITEMSDGKGDIAIFAAGYPKEMDNFINSNPGLKSRFKNHFEFHDYSPEELYQIAEFAAKKKGVVISKGAEDRLRKILITAYRDRDRTFGNARFAFSLIDEAKINLGMRIVHDTKQEKFTKAQLSTIKDVDIEDITSFESENEVELEVDNELLKEALDEINALCGLENIKQEINDLVKLSKYYRENGRSILKAFSMHSVFSGNPGTGKTTVARIMAKVYKALGMLERGHLIDADGSNLVAGYVGQTSLKTKEVVKEAMGGILFIDEAYAITEGHNTDFGKKAVAALIKEMEDHRGEFGVIVAGYTDNMSDFVESNPGIKSRFDQTFAFHDFNVDELWEIAESMLADKGLEASKEATDHLKTYIAFLYDNRDKFFGNARSMRKIVEKAVRNQELRMADLKKSLRTKKIKETLSIDDVKEFKPGEEKVLKRKPLGFRF
ncbi:MAG: AAA family ATPase [Marinilabiliales bacterium]|nr:MAG: AAA family ATPase [Marinilabiliales bacterium]